MVDEYGAIPEGEKPHGREVQVPKSTNGKDAVSQYARTLMESQSGQYENAVLQPKYSLNTFEDGRRFVDVQTDQAQFDGLSEIEKAKLSTKIIKERFAGK